VFEVAAGATVSVSGLTVSDGLLADPQNLAARGGGIRNAGKLTLVGCTVTHNVVRVVDDGGNDYLAQGGGIASPGDLVLIDSAVTGNSASVEVPSPPYHDSNTVEGGGIWSAGALQMVNSSVTGNSVAETGSNLVNGIVEGGGLCLRGTAEDLTDCTVADNRGGGRGGGIYQFSGTLTLTGCDVRGNLADSGGGLDTIAATLTGCTVEENTASQGGGLANSKTLTLTACTVANNTSAAAGGGLFSYNTATLTNCTFVGNTAAGTGFGGGGGIFRYTGSLALTSCTLTGNSAPQGGGGVASYSTPGPVQLVNTIVAGNTGGGSPDVHGAFASLGHNLIGATDGGTGWVPSDLTGTAANPLDPVLGPLQDNGGPTQTMALLPGSPALDAGDNAYAPQWDQRGPGFPRIVGGIIDLGAFEVQDGGPGSPAALLGQPPRPAAHPQQWPVWVFDDGAHRPLPFFPGFS
jgi:hypothetical protein